MIAQEVEPLYPELVTTSHRDGMKSLSYAALTVPLIKAVQELKSKNDEQANALADLRQEIAALKKEIVELKTSQAHPD